MGDILLLKIYVSRKASLNGTPCVLAYLAVATEQIANARLKRASQIRHTGLKPAGDNRENRESAFEALPYLTRASCPIGGNRANRESAFEALSWHDISLYER